MRGSSSSGKLVEGCGWNTDAMWLAKACWYMPKCLELFEVGGGGLKGYV
jgi:hypothetical protein